MITTSSVFDSLELGALSEVNLHGLREKAIVLALTQPEVPGLHELVLADISLPKPHPNYVAKNFLREEFVAHCTNPLVSYLVHDIADLIRKRPEFHQDTEVIAAFIDFANACCKQPAIVPYMSRILENDSPNAGLTRKQFEVFMMGVFLRSVSTGITIPQAVADLQADGKGRFAKAVNENLHDEVGVGFQSSHLELLFYSFMIMGNSLHCHYLDQDIADIALELYQVRRERNDLDFGNRDNELEQFVEILHSRNFFKRGECFSKVPPPKSFRIARYFCNLADETITFYHDNILRSLVHQKVEPVRQLPVTMLELAQREASSVFPSFIQSWDGLQQAYVGYIDRKVITQVIQADTRTQGYPGVLYNNERIGWENGPGEKGILNQRYVLRKFASAWGELHRDGEEDHAHVARSVAMNYLHGMSSPTELVFVLRKSTEFIGWRDNHWNYVVGKMNEYGETVSESNPRLPFRRKPVMDPLIVRILGLFP